MRIVIFGGTGSLGRALCRVILKESPKAKVYIVSRCELRQKEHKKEFPKLNATYVLGDVRDFRWRLLLPSSCDTVYNLAASKHVEVCEENVDYAVQVNYDGVKNTYAYARASGADYRYTSTDKAVRPVNAYGMAKALGEKYLMDKPGAYIYRWGNILGSRGSFLHVMKDKLLKGESVPLTDSKMTRFWLHIDDVAAFLYASPNSKILIPDMKSAPLTLLVAAVACHLDVSNYKTHEIGLRPGEKLHEEISWHVSGKSSSKKGFEMNFEEALTLVGRVLK